MYTELIRRERVTFRASILGKQNKHDYYYAYCQYYDDECIDNKCWSREKYNGLYIWKRCEIKDVEENEEVELKQ